MTFASTLVTTATAGWSWLTIAVGIGGIVAGALLMASLTTDWQRLPQYLRLWSRALKAQVGWAVLAVGSIGVLVFY